MAPRRTRKRIMREVISPLIRRPNAASKSSSISVPYWAYSVSKHMKNTRKVRKNKFKRYRRMTD